ncbi:MAG: gluconolactonase [Acidimicrobiia bacterium]|nr:gluconolactonase [Acidimicrobiia bacterium]
MWVDGRVYLTEIASGTIACWTGPATAQEFATTGGGPNGATRRADGSLYVTQNGGGTSSVAPGIQRVTPEGAVESVATDFGGQPFQAPNDLAFGPDGRLYFTDPPDSGSEGYQERTGRIFALDLDSGNAELVREVGTGFPNGIGFLADGTLVWSESISRRLMALRDGAVVCLAELPERHHPDGFCVGADGALYVACTFAHCVAVVVGGTVVDRLMCGDGMVTNCCFGGTDLYVTESRHGTLWRFPLGVEGLDLHG